MYLPDEGDWGWWWRGVFLPSRCGLSIFLKGVVMVRTQEPMLKCNPLLLDGARWMLTCIVQIKDYSGINRCLFCMLVGSSKLSTVLW